MVLINICAIILWLGSKIYLYKNGSWHTLRKAGGRNASVWSVLAIFLMFLEWAMFEERLFNILEPEEVPWIRFSINMLFMFILFPCLLNLKTFISPCSHSVMFSKMALRCQSIFWELTQRSPVPSKTQTAKSPTRLTKVSLSKSSVKKPTVPKTIVKSSSQTTVFNICL